MFFDEMDRISIRTRCPTHTTLVYNSKIYDHTNDEYIRDFQSTVSLIIHKTHVAWLDKTL